MAKAVTLQPWVKTVGKTLGKAAKSPKSSKTPDLFADAG